MKATITGTVVWRELKKVNTKRGPAEVVEVKVKDSTGKLFRANAWQDTVREGALRVSKGDTVTIVGKVTERTYTNRDGEECVSNDVLLDSILLFGNKTESRETSHFQLKGSLLQAKVTFEGKTYEGFLNPTQRTSSQPQQDFTAEVVEDDGVF